MATCRQCGNELNDSDAFCSKCGTPVEKYVTCPNCNHLISERARFCIHCGYDFGPEHTPDQTIPAATPQQTQPDATNPDQELELELEPDPEPSNGGGGNLKWILVAIAIIAIGGAIGYYFYSDLKGKEEAAMLAEKARQDSIAKENARIAAEK